MDICDPSFAEFGATAPPKVFFFSPPSTSCPAEVPHISHSVSDLKKDHQRVIPAVRVRGPTPQSVVPSLNPSFLVKPSVPDQQRQRRSLLVTSSDEWTTLGTNPLFTPSQPSWMVISPDRTKAKISLVSSVKACSTLMASRADVST